MSKYRRSGKNKEQNRASALEFPGLWRLWPAVLIGAIKFVIMLALTPIVPAIATENKIPEPAQAPLSKSDALRLLADNRFAQPSNWHWGYFKNADSASIRYGFAEAKKPIGTVVLLPGFTEFGEVYFETIKDFLAHGYTVYEMDWRGSGGSDRYLTAPKEIQKATSLGFNHDVDDLDQFINTVVYRHSKGPFVIVAHSLGSHIALRYLHDHPGGVNKAILSAPPFDCPGTTAPPWAVLATSWVKCSENRGNDYLDGQGDWTVMAAKISKMITHSHDPVRVRLEEAWATIDPRLQSGGATWKWLYLFQQSCNLTDSHDYAAAITTPLLMGCATSDYIASPKHEEQVASLLPGCQLFKDEGARHDLFLEDDAHRGPWMQAVFRFLAAPVR